MAEVDAAAGSGVGICIAVPPESHPPECAPLALHDELARKRAGGSLGRRTGVGLGGAASGAREGLKRLINARRRRAEAKARDIVGRRVAEARRAQVECAKRARCDLSRGQTPRDVVRDRARGGEREHDFALHGARQQAR